MSNNTPADASIPRHLESRPRTNVKAKARDLAYKAKGSRYQGHSQGQRLTTLPLTQGNRWFTFLKKAYLFLSLHNKSE